MKTERAPFMPVTPDFDDDRLEQLASAKGVGALVRPETLKPRAGQGTAPSRTAPQALPATPADDESRPVAAADHATPRSRMKTINLELPDYVWTDLKIRSAHQQVSVRHLIMHALKGQGIAIREADMIEDGRRLRGVPHS